APAPVATTTPSPQAIAKAAPQAPSVQKESVFVRLANRIKALERNMSLSGQYLEELSRRYKKQVEEMQKAFNRTLQAVHEASRIGEEREARRQEEMQQLQQQLSQLSESLQGLIGERDSWLSRLNVIAQHLILICVEVLLFVLLMYFCRRIPDTGRTGNEEISQKQNLGTRSRKGSRAAVKRRRSVEGSYQDLLISDPGVSEIDGLSTISKADARRRRRKKKDLLSRSASIRLPVKSSEPLVDIGKEQKSVPSRRANSLELGVWWASSNGVDTAIEEDEKVEKDSEVLVHHQQCSSEQTCLDSGHSPAIESISPHSSVIETSSQQLKDSQRQIKSSNTNTCELHTKFRSVSDTVSPLAKNNGLVRSNALGSVVQRQLSSPVFMRTATSVRSSRLGSVEPSPPAKLKSDNWEWYSTHHGLDKSSQPNKVTCSISCPGSGSVDPNQRQNGHSAPDNIRRSSNASSSASSASNISEGTSHKETSKKGPSSLKKMVKKFF
ncbi:Uncharacterized protein GBIM_15603, partial [Gryllus bimaculatus]